MIRQLKSWQKYKTKPAKADTTILGNKTLRYFRKFNNSTINENTDLLEYLNVLCNDCIICQLNKPYPNQNQIAQKQDFKGQKLYFNHRISFDRKGPISPTSEGNSYIMVIVDAFTHYVALNPVPHCNAYYAYTTLYEHWIAKFGLPEILVTDNGSEFIDNEIISA